VKKGEIPFVDVMDKVIRCDGGTKTGGKKDVYYVSAFYKNPETGIEKSIDTEENFVATAATESECRANGTWALNLKTGARVKDYVAAVGTVGVAAVGLGAAAYGIYRGYEGLKTPETVKARLERKLKELNKKAFVGQERRDEIVNFFNHEIRQAETNYNAQRDKIERSNLSAQEKNNALKSLNEKREVIATSIQNMKDAEISEMTPQQQQYTIPEQTIGDLYQSPQIYGPYLQPHQQPVTPSGQNPLRFIGQKTEPFYAGQWAEDLKKKTAETMEAERQHERERVAGSRNFFYNPWR
jgi:hypothetical protein